MIRYRYLIYIFFLVVIIYFISTPKLRVYEIPKDKMEFFVSESRPNDAEFYINSNFFDKNHNPIGLVKIDGKIKSLQTKGGSFFSVNNGVIKIGRKTPAFNSKHISQSLLWGINGGKINKKLINKKHAKKKVYRSLIGEKKDGSIFIIVSSRIGFVTIEEILLLGEKMKIENAILFDGGSSLDYKFNKRKFTALHSFFKKVFKIRESTTYIVGRSKN